ncbi:hypothetical protein BSL78_18671 [Apostichopus japonicus]|uniref:NACHT domain-containing protein n=1 Tax=Stichopus japonicus TaxID=307972 RepID=A0A2G8K8W2_STIJA|nr:hypothetical protein BSL78_18671 [Apostichopus japonicus]
MAVNEAIGPALTERKISFINQLKSTYKDWYSSIKPVPSSRDSSFNIDDVIVEGGIERQDDDVEKNNWTPLQSYQELCTDLGLGLKRRILQAEAGYGKTTLTLQLAYEWCNDLSTSSMKDVEILILLKLGQVISATSLFEVIKTTLLPKDFKIQSNEISDMLDTATSVVVILDDVDEYVENNKHIPKDILNKIQNNPRLELILTARSFSKELESQSKRLRLSGFTSDAQDKYIRKAVTKDDRKATDNINHSSKEFSEYKSVTSFFRYIDSSLHLRGKTDTDYGIPDHKELNRIAFESLSGYNRRNSWRKENLSSQIGRRALKHFLQTGILQEKCFAIF